MKNLAKKISKIKFSQMWSTGAKKNREFKNGIRMAVAPFLGELERFYDFLIIFGLHFAILTLFGV